MALHCEFIFAEPFSDIQSAGGLYSYAQEHENVPFQIIEENFNIQMDESLRSIISDAIWDRDNVSDVVIENDGYMISCFED